MLICRRLYDKSAENVVAVFPFIVLKLDTCKIELTEFQLVEPSPPDIKIKDDGINPFVGVLA